MSNRAWVTLATNDSYGLGALVLAHSLRRAGSAYPSVVLITPSVTEAMRERLRAVFAEVVTVDVLDSRDAAHLALLQRPELGITFTKIHCWNLTQYEKCVFLDADILVVQNCDELFEREELSAAPDVGWPDCFNSGVFVFTPSTETFNQLIAFARERGSFDGGDQGLLNSFFSDWARGDINKHLPFLYNVTSAAFYSYLPALKHYGQNLKVIHFIGAAKPWLQHFNWDSSTVDAPEHLREFLQLWWDLFVAQVHSQLDTSMSGVAGNFARVVPGSVSQGEALDELTRRQGWEAGNIDYMGADSFANIWAKISQTLSQPRTSPAKSPPRESTPSKSAPMEDKPAEVILETTTEPVEIAKEATEATTLAEVPAQTEVVAPLETPAVSATGVEAAAKIEGTVPVDAATPGKASVPVQAVVPVKTAASVEPAAPVEIATLVGTTATAETVAPVENAAPVETSMPDVAPVKVDAPIEVATLVEAVAQIEAPKPTAEAPVTDPVKESTEKVTPDIPLTVEAAAPSVREIVETSAEITTPPEVPVTVEASEKIQVIPTTEAPVQIPVEALQKTECIVPVASAPVAAKAPQAPSDIPVPVETAAEIPVPVETAPEAKKTESAETPAVQSEAVIVSELVAKALKPSDAVEACPASPAVAAEAPEPPLEATPPKVQAAPASDSPPLAHTPSKEEAPAVPAAKSEERRKPAGKLQLSPPAAPDPLPTPDSEAEDAAALAHSIIASELQAAATPTPPTPVDRLTVEEPEVPTPPVGAVSLAQIGVKPVKGKPTIAAQIESSVTEKDDSAATPPAPAQAATAETPKEAAKVAPKDAPKEAPKKKVVKKVVKKESGASGAGGDAPVPPPRKKEKKPKEK